MGTPTYAGDATGDAACNNGTRGPVCAVCDHNYYLFSGACTCAAVPILLTIRPHSFLLQRRGTVCMLDVRWTFVPAWISEFHSSSDLLACLPVSACMVPPEKMLSSV